MVFQPSEALEYARSPEGLAQIRILATQGKTLKEIANFFQVTTQTFFNWRRKYDEISQVLSDSQKIADDLVEESLYESCFARTEKEITIEKDGDGNITKQVVKTKYIPANFQAQQFWLSNRQKDTWKSSRTEISTPTGTCITFVNDIPNTFVVKDDDDRDAKVMESYKQTKNKEE